MSSAPTDGRIALATAIVAGLVSYLLHGFLYSIDSQLAWPVIDTLRHPGRLPATDLVVDAAGRTPFLFYRLLALEPWFGDDHLLRDRVLYLPLFVAYALAHHALFRHLLGRGLLPLLALACLFVSDAKLQLNAAQTPNYFLVSASAIGCVPPLAALLFLRRRPVAAAALAALAVWLHPGIGISLFLTLTLATAVAERQRLRQLAGPWLLAAALFALPLLYLAGGDARSGIDRAAFFELLRQFQYHAYLEDHFRDGYAYFIVAAALLAGSAGCLPFRLDRRLLAFSGSALLVCLAWLANLYAEGSIGFHYTYAVTRIFYVLKPLVLAGLLAVAAALWQRGGVDRLLAAAVAASLLGGAPAPSCLILLVAWGRLAGLPRPPPAALLYLLALGLGAALSWRQAASPGAWLLSFVAVAPLDNRTLWLDLLAVALLPLLPRPHAATAATAAVPAALPRAFVVVVAALVAAKLLAFTALRFPDEIRDPGRLDLATLRERSLLPNLRRDDAAGGDRAAFVDTLAWIRDRVEPGRLFLVPPDDLRFLALRHVAGQGLYVTSAEINQLHYSPPQYFEARRRLDALGLVRHGKYRHSYRHYPNGDLRALTPPVDYAVLPAADGRCPAATEVHANAGFRICRLRPAG